MFLTLWKNNKKGISVVELLVVIAIIGIILISFLGLIIFSLRASTLNQKIAQANFLTQETMEAVRSFRDGTIWDSDGLGILNVDVAYYPQKTADIPAGWALVEGEESRNGFIRKVIFETVYRDGNDNIAESGIEDPNTKKVTVSVWWQKIHEVKLVTYLTNWK